MVMIVASGMLSGGLGGLIAYATYNGVKQMENMGQENNNTPKNKSKKPYKRVILLASILLIFGLVYVLGDFGNNDNTDIASVVSVNASIDESLTLNMAQPLLVTGDVVNGGYIENYQDLLTFEYYNEDDSTDIRIETTTFLNTLETYSNDNIIYLIGNDGFMVGLDSDTLDDTYVAYNQDNGWMFISDKHPVNSGIKNMSEIVVVSKTELEDFNIIKDGENNFYSYGEMRMMMTDIIQVLDGVSKLDDIEIDVMKIKEVVPVSDFISADSSVMIATEDGELIYEYGDVGYLEFSQGNIRYHTSDLITTYQNVVGIMENPPSASIKDHYTDVQHYLDQGEKVLSIFVDGFSYIEYQALISDDEVDFMDTIENVQPATVGFKPVTNVGFATMLTGVDPIIHGVHDRSYRELAVPSIFDYCNEKGITNGLIEGDAQILLLDTETILNTDENNNGITDDEIQQTAMNVINNYEYVMVHYHSVDDFGHDYGDVVDETMNELKVVDGYIEELVAQWDGKVILLADHGMHSTEDGGDHGMFRTEDFIVPYMIFDGGLYEKE